MRFTEFRRPARQTLGVLASACLFALFAAGSAVGVEMTSAKKPVGTVTKYKGNMFRINGIPVTSVPATLFKGQRLTTSGTVEVWFSVKYGGTASCDALPGSV